METRPTSSGALPESIDVVVIGGGQAGIAMSEHLSANDIPHIVLERHRIAERWRSERWDSLVTNGPAWHDRFPGAEFPGDPEGFVAKEGVADYFAAYAEMINAPIHCGVEVTRVSRLDGQAGFLVETTAGDTVAGRVVAATGPFQRPVIPSIVPNEAPVVQIHSNAYRSPEQLPPGAVLVVGGGSSGAQIADELLAAGRRVFLSVSAHGRPPRRYRDRDFVWWLGVLNKWDLEAVPGSTHITIAVSGAGGGSTVEFREFAARGMTLVGTTESFAEGRLSFADDLLAHLREGDADYLALLDEADAYVAAQGLDLPEEPEAHLIPPDPECATRPIRSLDLAEEGIGSIIWATGYEPDFGWLQVAAIGPDGRPVHRRGVSAEPGVYFVGLSWQTRRGSAFIWGVWYDAKYVTDHIAKQRVYDAYTHH